MDVYHQLGAGFLEGVYQEALAIEFTRRRIPFEREKRFSVYYKGIELEKKYQVDFSALTRLLLKRKRFHNFPMSRSPNCSTICT